MTNLQIAKLYLAANAGTDATALDAAITDGSALTAVTALTQTALLNAAYQAAFGRDADAEGLAYWGDRLDNGLTTTGLVDQLVAGAAAYVAPTAENPLVIGDATFTAAAVGGENDVAVAASKAAVEATTTNINVAEAALLLKPVVDATTEAAAATAVTTDYVVKSASLTTGTDTLTGGKANDTFTAALLTAGAGDSVVDSGTLDTDTLNIETSTAITDTFTTTNIENVSIAGLGTITANMTSMTGVESITNNASTGTLTLTNIAANAELTAKGTAGLTSATFTSAALQGSSDSLMVNLDGTSTASVTVNAGFESAKVNSISDSVLTGLTVPGVTTIITEGKGLTVTDGVLNAFTTIIMKNDGDVTLGTDSSVSLLSASEVTGDVKAQTIDTTTDTQDRDYATDSLTLAATGGTVLVGAGNDTLKVIAGTSGTDTIRMGAGNDNLVYVYGAGTSVVDMGAGDDLLFVNTATAGAASTDTIDLGDGTDTVVILDTNSSTAKLQNAENVSIVVNTGAKTVDLDGSSAVALTIENGTADTDITVANLTSGTTIKTINNDASTPVATGAVTVGFKANEASSAITFENKVGDGDATDIVTITKVADLTLDFNDTVLLGTGAIETIAVADTTNLTITAAKAFAVDDITVAADKTTDVTLTAASTVVMVDLNGTSLENVTVTAAGVTSIGANSASNTLATTSYTTTVGTLDAGAIGATTTTELTSVKLSAAGNVGATTQGAINAIKIGTIDATSTAGSVDLGAIGAATTTNLGAITINAKSNIGANNAATVDAVDMTSFTATSTDGTVKLGAFNATAHGDMGTISATGKGLVTIDEVGTGTALDTLTSLTATSSDSGIVLADDAVDMIDADGYNVTLTAATDIGGTTTPGTTVATLKNSDGNIGTIDLNGAATARVNATVVDAAGTNGLYVQTLDASGLTGGLTSVITNADDLASVSSTTTVKLGAASVATNNSVTFAGDVDAVSVTGSTGNDTVILTGAIDSGIISLTGTGTDTLNLDTLDGKGTTTEGMVINLSSNDVVVGTSSVASGKIAQWDGASTLTTSGVSLTVSGIDSILGTDTIDIIYAAGTGTTIDAGAGADTIVSGSGVDAITLGAGIDTVVFAATTAANGVDTVADFVATNDILNFDAFVDIDGVSDLDSVGNTTTAILQAGVASTATFDIASKVVFLDNADFADTAAIKAGVEDATGNSNMGLADGAKAVIIYGDINATTAGDLSVYYMTGATGATDTLTLVGTITTDDLDAHTAGQFIVA